MMGKLLGGDKTNSKRQSDHGFQVCCMTRYILDMRNMPGKAWHLREVIIDRLKAFETRVGVAEDKL